MTSDLEAYQCSFISYYVIWKSLSISCWENGIWSRFLNGQERRDATRGLFPHWGRKRVDHSSTTHIGSRKRPWLLHPTISNSRAQDCNVWLLKYTAAEDSVCWCHNVFDLVCLQFSLKWRNANSWVKPQIVWKYIWISTQQFRCITKCYLKILSQILSWCISA